MSDEQKQKDQEPFVEVSIDFNSWAEAWLRDVMSREKPQIDVRELGALLRASFERAVPDQHVSVVEVHKNGPGVPVRIDASGNLQVEQK